MLSALNGSAEQPSVALNSIAQQPKEAASRIVNLFPSYQSFTACCWDWNKIKVNAVRAMDLMPDLTTVVESTEIFTRGTVYHFPTAFRVALASFCVLNFTLLHSMVPALRDLAVRLAAKPLSRSLAPGYVVRFTYWTALVSAFTALGVMGIKEFGDLLKLSTKVLGRGLGMVFPWIGYGMRVGGILQTMDIVSGLRFQRDIAKVLDLSPERPLTEEYEKALYDNTVPLLILKENAGRQKRALAALDVLEKSRVYLRRCNGYKKGLKGRVRELKKQLAVSWHNDVHAFARTYSEVIDLAKGLREKSVERSRYQAFGLGANCLALCGMFVTHVVGGAAISLASASFYMTQSVYGWQEKPTFSYEAKKEPELTHDEQVISAIASASIYMARQAA